MAIDQQQVWQAIYDLIFDSLTMAPPSGQPAAGAATTLLSLTIPGEPLDPTEYANPWTPMNPSGDPVTAENFAWLVDAVPSVSTVFAPNGSSIESLYNEIVQSNIPSTAPETPLAAPPAAPRSATSAVSASRLIQPASARALKTGVGVAANVANVANVARSTLVAEHARVVDLLPAKSRTAFGLLYAEHSLASPRGEPVKALVETPAFRKYLDRTALRDEASTRYMSQRLQLDLQNPADKQRWAAISGPL